MNSGSKNDGNVKQVVPFLRVASMETSLRYYLDGLGFTMENKWVVDGKVRWCWLRLGGAALMLQEFTPDPHHPRAPQESIGQGVSLCFQCDDAIAIYREAQARGIQVSEPQVGNSMWEISLRDPDGYRINFSSATDVPEDTKLSDIKT